MFSFGKRITLSISAFFSILGSGELPDDVVAAMVTPARHPEVPAAAPSRAAAPPAATPVIEDTGHRATQILAILQRDARLLDFIMEDLTPYPDAQVGAAVRDVQAGSRQVLDRYFTLEPVLDDEEGRPVTVEQNADPARIKVVGNVAGGPIRGVLRHRGWEATRVALPPLAASGLTIIAPAEVEVS